MTIPFELLKGEKRSVLLYISTDATTSINYDLCDQVLVKIYHAEAPANKIEFKLVSEAAGDVLLTKVTVSNKTYVRFYLDTTSLKTGIYNLESKVTIAGVEAPVYKPTDVFMSLGESRTV